MGLFDDEEVMGPIRGGNPFVPTTLSSWMAREAALYALRMIQGQRWHGRLIGRDGIRDSDVLTLMGLAERDVLLRAPTIGEFRDACEKQLKRLEAKVHLRPDALSRNVEKLGGLLKLNAAECAVLRVAVVTTRTQYFGDLLRLVLVTERDLLRGLHFATGARFNKIREALSQEKTLRRSGFFSNQDKLFENHNPLEIDDDMVNGLLSHRFNEERLLRHLTRAAPKSTLTLADFAHLPDLDLVRRYLEQSVARRRKGANVLFYGPPGTGKTEFVRALAEASGITLNEVPNCNSSGDPISGQRRFRAYSTSQHLLASRRNQALLFDEVEDVFDDSMTDLLSSFPGPGTGQGGLRKSWINETIETNPVPAIWVCNGIGGMDPAYLRRFDLIVEFKVPTRSVRRRIVERYFGEGEISPGCIGRLVEIDTLTPALVERASRVARVLRSRSVSRRDDTVERVVGSAFRAMGCTLRSSAPTLSKYYDPTFLNTDRSLDAITQGLGRIKSARLCLYGPPGTGKTAFAHHLGQTLDRPVIVRRASDLLSPYIGGTEANLRKAFDTAREENAILLIDEADSFLQDRSGAHRQWEITQVNEFLTQMESFNGIFVASTNLIDRLDSASLRRFDFKVKFDYLTREQRRELLARVTELEGPETSGRESSIQRLDQMSHLTPGDFANVLRQLDVTGERRLATRIIDLLAAEASMKPGLNSPRIGFVHH